MEIIGMWNTSLNVTLRNTEPEHKIPARIGIGANSGALSFNMSIDANQARRMAATLNRLANELEEGND